MTISPATLSPIERLQYDSLGAILGLASQVTGTKGIITDADIPVIMRDIRSLACTSKAMHKAINDPRVLDIFFTSLANKYQRPPEDFACELDIVGSRKWLWERISRSEHAENYAVIRNIYQIAVEVIGKAKSAGLVSNFTVLKKTPPDPFTYQTQTGFMLYYDGSFPSIETPFGKLDFYKGEDPSSPLSLLEIFIKQLDATFAGTSYIGEHDLLDPNKNHIVPISDLNDHRIRKIEDTEGVNVAANDLRREIGNQNLITTRYFAGHSFYKIRKIGTQVMPKVTRPKEMLRSRFKTIPTMWKMFEKNRLGEDPTLHTKPLSHAKPTAPAVFRTLPDVYEDFFSFVRQLDLQPFREDGSKSLPIEKNYSMGFALPALNHAAKQFLDTDTHWDIDYVSGWDLKRTQPENKPYNLELLKLAYTQVLSEIGANWRKSNLKDYPNILQPKSEETHQLFIRQPRFEDEYRVINRAAEVLGILLNNYLIASDGWASKPAASLPPKPRPIYLWIKKDKLELVSSLLNLREPS